MISSLVINSSVEYLKHDGVIVTPSESCYGFSCSAESTQAVAKINALKGSREGMALTLLVDSIKQAEEFGVINEEAHILSKTFHPGQLNIIVSLIEPHKYSYLSPHGTIAFRIPQNEVLLELIKTFGEPITTTSVNMHGENPLYKIADVRAQFDHKVDAIIDAGDLDENTPPSTVYSTITHQTLREGTITKEMIQKVLA